MRILILNYEFPPLGGGAGNATYYLLKEFARYLDLKIDLITSSVNKARIEIFAPNITIYHIDIGKKNGDLQYQIRKNLLVYAWKSYWLAKRLKEKNGYDLVHAFFGIPCGYIALKLGLPYIVSLRGSDVPGHNPEFSMIYRFFSRAIRKTWKSARSVIANSEDLRKNSHRFLQIEIRVIPNGVDTEFFKPPEKKDDVFRILYVGRLHRVKNVDILIRSYGRLLDNHSGMNMELWVVGEGPEQKDLIQLVKYLGMEKEVRFWGHRSKSELLDYYRRASVFVLLSENEGMSNTVLEAMACGLPILTTATGGSEDLIRGNGVIVQKDVQVIADLLQELMKTPARLEEMGVNSRKIAEGMGWGRVAEEYFKIYKSCVA